MSLHVGERVRYWRELRGITQHDLATRARIEKSRLCRIEKGGTRARADEVEALAKAMSLSMPEFYGAAAS